MTEKKRRYNRIKAVMVDKGISREEMAVYLEKNVRTMSRYLTNDIQPSIPDLYKIAEKCRVEVRELLVSSLEPPTYLED